MTANSPLSNVLFPFRFKARAGNPQAENFAFIIGFWVFPITNSAKTAIVYVSKYVGIYMDALLSHRLLYDGDNADNAKSTISIPLR